MSVRPISRNLVITIDPASTNLGYKTFLNGTLVSNIMLDTSHVATDTIDYVATDDVGNTATSTRVVIIGPVSSAEHAGPARHINYR
jgi:hypothetical protein